MNKIYFSEGTELNIIKKVLLQLDRKKGYKIFLPFSKFVALTNFIMFNQFPNTYEFWIDITNNVDDITGEENCVLYYDFGRNPNTKNIIKAKSILPENKTLVVKVNLNINSKIDIMKIWNYNCDIFFDNDTYDIETVKEIFSFWQSKRHSYNRKILDFELLLSFNLDERTNTYYINNNELQIKNYIDNSFDLNLNTIKEIENKQVVTSNISEQMPIVEAVEQVEVKEETKKFKSSEFISPVFGKDSNRTNDDFLKALKDFRSNL